MAIYNKKKNLENLEQQDKELKIRHNELLKELSVVRTQLLDTQAEWVLIISTISFFWKYLCFNRGEKIEKEIRSQIETDRANFEKEKIHSSMDLNKISVNKTFE